MNSNWNRDWNESTRRIRIGGRRQNQNSRWKRIDLIHGEKENSIWIQCQFDFDADESEFEFELESESRIDRSEAVRVEGRRRIWRRRRSI